MLTKSDNVYIYYIPHILSRKGHIRIVIGRKTFNFLSLRFNRSGYNIFLKDQQTKPFRITINKKVYWMFEGKFYKDSDELSASDVKALILSRQRLKQNRINRAKTITSVTSLPIKLRRGSISDDIKLIVWQRDGGRCVKCGSQSELQYDHIIPFSVGGASTTENLQILCGICNRAKSASVA
jgi:5-methylcytosine-specific restriction endonuclease McrA